jgi:hypothetical protein
MKSNRIALNALKNAVKNYQEQAGFADVIIRQHQEAMECWECQSFLQLGINVFKWLEQADLDVRRAVYDRKMEYDPDWETALTALYAEWLKACDFAEKWSTIQTERGFALDNLEEFRKCCAAVRALVKYGEGRLLNPRVVAAQDRAIEEYRKGNTLEFWSNEELQDA